jgi:EAL domain-containing protein (putative c-di-GMP-specific phosphodiesterase class I)/CheY-like chemotaxis protein
MSNQELDQRQACRGILGRKVLVVEDCRTERAHAVSLIKSMGALEVAEACDGVQALRILDLEPEIDLIFCDLEMPRMDGMELIGQIGARPLTPHLILLSSMATGILESVRHMALSYGFPFAEIIAKPLTGEKIVELFASIPLPDQARSVPLPVPGRGDLTLNEIRRGLDHGEFECFFQPQLAMENARLKGVESLVRWRHPDLGLLSPAAFLPRIEDDFALMCRLTAQILERTARQWHRWNMTGLPLNLSVNFSASSLGSEGFSDQILEFTGRHGFLPENMVLEITESASVINLGQTLANLARLRMRGFQLSLDDFGTGYATYQQLDRIPFTELKVDLSITRELPRSQKQTILTRNVIQLAKDLDLRVVAEGIETQECWDLLKELGCDFGQGYFLARPMPGDLLRNWASRDRSHLCTG